MRALKIMLALACLMSTASVVVGVLPVDLPRNWGYSNIHSPLGVTESLLSTLVYGAALYGIHKRTVTAWRLGWAYLGAAYISWMLQCLSLTRTIAQADSPRVAFAAAAIAATLVTVYWGLWWKKQRGYFKNNL